MLIKYLGKYTYGGFVSEGLSAQANSIIYFDGYTMAIWVVEFSNGGTKLERILLKNQHTHRKLLNFENWVNGGLRSFQKSEF